MKHCLRCNQPCAITTVFCEDCRSLLRTQLQQRFVQTPPSASRASKGAETRNVFTSITEYEQPLHRFRIAHPTSLQEKTPNVQDDFLPQTPLTYTPEIAGSEEAEDEEDLSQPLADMWPQLDNTDSDMDEDEDESGPWVDQADPLTSRHLPNSAETIDIAETLTIPQGDRFPGQPPGAAYPGNDKAPRPEDDEGFPPYDGLAGKAAYSRGGAYLRPGTQSPWRLIRRIPISPRIAFIVLIVLAVLALVADSILLAIDFTHQPAKHTQNGVPPAPILTITPNAVHPGQIVLLHIGHFSSETQVFVTRDIHQSVRTDAASPLIKVGGTGDANVHLLIDDTWKPGFHIIQGEDVTTHYTASTTLQVVGAGPMRPPHLVLSQTSLNMGNRSQFENTIQSLVLRNSGGSSILWTASSDQPWLMFTPTQGIFSDSQSIYVAVARGNLKPPGDYHGTITIISNTGVPNYIQVKMSVLPLSARSDAVLAVAPPVLSFTATDGGTDPSNQLLTVSNPGSQPLNWSLAPSSLAGDDGQNLPFQFSTNWLSTDLASGIISAGSKTAVRVIVHSHSLLPSVYGALLTFTSGREGLNSPQAVVVTLTIQPRCGVTTSMGNMSFTAISGQSAPVNEVLSLGTTANCTGTLNWQAFSSASWLNVTPIHGQLQPNAGAVTTVGVSAGTLQPGTHNGLVVFMTGQSTQTVIVQLTVLASSLSPTVGGQPNTPASPGSGSIGQGTPQPTASTPPGTAGAFSVSPLNLNFSTTQGQANPPGQVVKISNNGRSSLNWQANVNASASTWLNVKPTSGSVAAGQSSQTTVNADATGLPPGTYSTQVSVTATDATGAQVQGSPQIISVTLTVSQACTLEVTPSSLSFTVSLLQPNPPGQNIQLTEVGSCTYPISWKVAADKNWIVLSQTSGSDSGSGSVIVVHVNGSGIVIGHYTGQITISAVAPGGRKVQGSPQSVSVSMTVLT
jgi:hypothetical protein